MNVYTGLFMLTHDQYTSHAFFFSDHARESGFSFKRTLSSDENVVTKPRTDYYDMSSLLQILSGKAFFKAFTRREYDNRRWGA